MWRRRLAFTRERVDRLRAFADLLIEAAVLRRERVQLVERIRLLLIRPVLLERIHVIVAEAEASYPGHTVSVSLMDDVTNAPLAEPSAPWDETYCRYVVAAGRPFQVTDSFTDLIVCDSPNAGRVRSYNGVPLIISSWAVGVLCIYAPTPRDSWTEDDMRLLEHWATVITSAMETELALL